MVIETAQLVIGAAIAGTWSAVVTSIVLRVEVRWIKRALGKLESRTDRLEVKVFQENRS